MSVELSTIGPIVYNVKFYGALGNGSTDDTSAIQTAINAAHTAGGGIVYFPLGIYVIGGALVTSLSGHNPNCQLYIPLTVSGTVMPRIKLLGEAPPNWASEVISGSPRNTRGVILKSTIVGSGTKPCVIGTSWDASSMNFNYCYTDIENIVVQTRTKTGSTHIAPTMSGINFLRMAACHIENVCVQTEDTGADLLSPISGDTTAIALSDVNNKGVVRLTNSKVEGYGTGVSVSEHAFLNQVIFGANANALVTTGGNHAATAISLLFEGNINNLVGAGTLTLNIFSYYTEHDYGGYWYDFLNDIKNISGSAVFNIINSKIVIGGGGTEPFVISGSPIYKVHNGDGQTEFPNNYFGDTYKTIFERDDHGWSGAGTGTPVLAVDVDRYKMDMNGTGGSSTIFKSGLFAPGRVLRLTVDVHVISGTNNKLSVGDISSPEYTSSTLTDGVNVIDVVTGAGWPVTSNFIQIAAISGRIKVRSIKREFI